MPERLSNSSPDASLEPQRWDARTVLRFLDVLEGFSAVVLGVIGSDGRVRRANAGFRRLIAGDGATPTTLDGIDARAHVVRPSYDDLTAAPTSVGQVVYRGPVTFLDRRGVSRSVRAIALRFSDELMLFGEHDLAEYEQLIDSLMDLNEELAETQRALVRTQRDLEAAEATQRDLASTDPLTGVRNRRYVLERLHAEADRAQRAGTSVSLALFDLDDLKGINDRFGHAGGDAALKGVADALRTVARSYDVPARFAGDEWLLLLPGTTIDDALRVANRVLEVARTIQVAGFDLQIRLSAGVASLAARDDTPDRLLQRADEALYRAKATGRNRAVVAAPPDTEGAPPLA